MTARTNCHRLRVADPLFRFMEDEVLPAVGLDSAKFWSGFDTLVHELAPKNLALLAERDRLQVALDDWHRQHPGSITDMAAYIAFLEGIGYLQPRPVGTKVTTTNVDAELALLAGPQLVVPLLNARYALNAANARWGSLYDALYGTDVIPDSFGPRTGPYNARRGAAVIAYARTVLDKVAPLLGDASHRDAVNYSCRSGQLVVSLASGLHVGLKDPNRFVGFKTDDGVTLNSLLLRNNGLHIDILIDRKTPIGSADPAGVCDVVLEAAL